VSFPCLKAPTVGGLLNGNPEIEMKNLIPLKEVADIIMGQSPPSHTYNELGDGLPFFQGKAEFGQKYPVARKWCSKPNKVAETDDILLSVRAPVGSTNIANTKSCIGRGLAAIRCKNNKADPFFLWFYLRSIEKRIASKGVGSIFTAIGRDVISKLPVPDFKYPTQRKIAAILEKAESARAKCREANRLTDEFLKSAFIDMFGDPISNPKEWEVKRFNEVYESIRYATSSPPDYIPDGVPFIRATNIKNGTVITNGLKHISFKEAKQLEKCKLSYGNLIIVISGVNAGDCAVIPKQFDNACAGYDLILELPYESAIFYNHLINSSFGKTMIAPLKRRAGQPHLNAEQIGSLNFIAPPQKEQQKFANIVQKVEKLKEKQRESEKELDNLFNSLMQRAFRGEIT